MGRKFKIKEIPNIDERSEMYHKQLLVLSLIEWRRDMEDNNKDVSNIDFKSVMEFILNNPIPKSSVERLIQGYEENKNEKYEADNIKTPDNIGRHFKG